MRRRGRGGGEVIVVADFEGVEVLLDFLFIFGFVGSDEGDLLPVGAPCELLDAVGYIGEAMRFTSGHRQDEELELGIFRGRIDCFKRESVAFGRPTRRSDALAIVRQRARSAAGDVDDQQIAVAVLLRLNTQQHESQSDGLPSGKLADPRRKKFWRGRRVRSCALEAATAVARGRERPVVAIAAAIARKQAARSAFALSLTVLGRTQRPRRIRPTEKLPWPEATIGRGWSASMKTPSGLRQSVARGRAADAANLRRYADTPLKGASTETKRGRSDICRDWARKDVRTRRRDETSDERSKPPLHGKNAGRMPALPG